MSDSNQLLFIPDPIKKKKLSRYINEYIDIPRICPICGSKDAFKTLKIEPKYYFTPYKRDYKVSRDPLRIYLCEKHSKNNLKPTLITLLSVFLMFILPFIIFIIIIIYFTPRMIIIAFILSAVSVGLGFSGIYYEVKKENKYLLMIKKKFFFEYYRSVGIVVSINCSEWANKFNGSNNCYIVNNIDYEKLTNLENSRLKYEKNMKSLFKLISIIPIIFIPSLVLFIVLIPAYIYILSAIFITLAIFLTGIFIYEIILNALMIKQRFLIFQQFKSFQEFKFNNQL